MTFVRAAVVTVTLAAVLGLAPMSSASRAPRPLETRGIVASVKREFTSVPRLRVGGIRISTVNSNFAKASVSAPNTSGAILVVLVHTYRGGWFVFNYGSAYLGCWVPPRIARDLRLDTGGC
ncbi:MAG: hypothetical protein M3540_10975 [Actinomycetota bacterium]|nr:hypothetical protein [Actinomycetota bacterium]